MMSSQNAGQGGPPNNNEGSHPEDGDTIEEDKPVVSLVLQSILANQRMTHQEFFDRIWQNQPYLMKNVFQENGGAQGLLHHSHRCYPPTEACLGGDGQWRDDNMKTTPWNEMVYQGWNILSSILETAASVSEGIAKDEHGEAPLVLRNLEVLPRDEVLSLYGTSLFSSYLDGCSIVLNHADLLSPYIAALCEDLQYSFPHAYANSYLTPPDSQTVPPHADDRDVLIFQLVGSKDWQVYQTIPVPYPYPHEQVGKAGMPVPTTVLDGPVALSVRLEPGDVLYMPRGVVHQARSTPDSPSFHVTIALATHDWTLAGNLGRAIQRHLNGVVDYRRSLLPMTMTNATTSDTANSIQQKIDIALERIRQEVTAPSLLNDLEGRIENHNRRAFLRRASRIHQARIEAMDNTNGTTGGNMRQIQEKSDNNGQHDAIDDVVGPMAAKAVTYSTIIRAASGNEREHAQNKIMATTTTTMTTIPPPSDGRIMPPTMTTTPPPPQQQQQTQQQPRGLNVREDIGDSIMEIISKVKADPTQSYRVVDLKRLLDVPNILVCDLSLLSLAKRAVELGAFAVVVVV